MPSAPPGGCGDEGVLIKQQTVPLAPSCGCGPCRWSHPTVNKFHLHHLPVVGTAGAPIKQQTVTPAPPYGCARCRCSRQTAKSVTCTTLRQWAEQVDSSNQKQCHLHRTTIVGTAGVLTKQQTMQNAPPYGSEHYRCAHQAANSATFTEPGLWVLQVFPSNSKQFHLYHLTAVSTPGVLIKQHTVPPAPRHGYGRCRCSHQTAKCANCILPWLWTLPLFSSNYKQCPLHRLTVVVAVGVLIKQQTVVGYLLLIMLFYDVRVYVCTGVHPVQL